MLSIHLRQAIDRTNFLNTCYDVWLLHNRCSASSETGPNSRPNYRKYITQELVCRSSQLQTRRIMVGGVVPSEDEWCGWKKWSFNNLCPRSLKYSPDPYCIGESYMRHLFEIFFGENVNILRIHFDAQSKATITCHVPRRSRVQRTSRLILPCCLSTRGLRHPAEMQTCLEYMPKPSAVMSGTDALLEPGGKLSMESIISSAVFRILYLQHTQWMVTKSQCHFPLSLVSAGLKEYFGRSWRQILRLCTRMNGETWTIKDLTNLATKILVAMLYCISNYT